MAAGADPFEWGNGPDNETSAYVNQQGIRQTPFRRNMRSSFYPAIFNNFAARMDWAKDGKGNRNPVVVINDDAGLAIITNTRRKARRSCSTLPNRMTRTATK